MAKRSWMMWTVVAVVGGGLAQDVAAAAEPPLSGCYERVYDAAHLSAHAHQIVTRASLSIKAAPAELQTDDAHPFIATGELKVWVRGRKESFDSTGACQAQGEGLLCRGSLSAAETETCESKADGVRDCRIDPSESGAFQIEGKPEGLLLKIPERLELVPAPYDGGPFLSLSEKNAENSAFLLMKVPEGCN